MEQVFESLQAKCYVYPDAFSIKPHIIGMRISVRVSAGPESIRRIPRTVLQRGPLKSGLRGGRISGETVIGSRCWPEKAIGEVGRFRKILRPQSSLSGPCLCRPIAGHQRPIWRATGAPRLVERPTVGAGSRCPGKGVLTPKRSPVSERWKHSIPSRVCVQPAALTYAHARSALVQTCAWNHTLLFINLHDCISTFFL